MNRPSLAGRRPDAPPLSEEEVLGGLFAGLHDLLLGRRDVLKTDPLLDGLGGGGGRKGEEGRCVCGRTKGVVDGTGGAATT